MITHWSRRACRTCWTSVRPHRAPIPPAGAGTWSGACSWSCRSRSRSASAGNKCPASAWAPSAVWSRHLLAERRILYEWKKDLFELLHRYNDVVRAFEKSIRGRSRGGRALERVIERRKKPVRLYPSEKCHRRVGVWKKEKNSKLQREGKTFLSSPHPGALIQCARSRVDYLRFESSHSCYPLLRKQSLISRLGRTNICILLVYNYVRFEVLSSQDHCVSTVPPKRCVSNSINWNECCLPY